jgi:AcrR family transcriptional regulator
VSDPIGRTGTFVVEDERGAILAAFAEHVAENGYRATTEADTVARAGVEAEAFGRYFPDTEACFVAAYDAAAQQCFSLVAEAYIHRGGTWIEGAHAALAALLEFVAGTPAFARLATVEIVNVGPRGLAHRDKSLDLFMELLEPGYFGDSPPPSRLVSEMIAGGIFELMRRHAMEGRLEQLPDALPAITVVALAPFIGLTEARRLAALPRHSPE